MKFAGSYRQGLWGLRPGSRLASLASQWGSRSLVPLLVATCLLGGPMAGLAQEPAPEQVPEAEDSPPSAAQPSRNEVLEAWTDAWTPGEAHARLAAREGVWKLTTRTWGDPSEEPVVTETTAVRQMILGGRCLQERVMGEVQGFPFESLGHLGYDNVTGRWWSTWMDTLSTAVVVTSGTRDPRSREIVLTGEYADPLTGKPRKVRSVHRWLNLDTERFEWWETRDGVEVKTMEILYQRQTLAGSR